MRNKIVLISCLLVTELVVIFTLSAKIYDTRSNVMMMTIPIQKENVFYPSNSGLKYFYEHKPNRTIKDMSGSTIINTINSDTLNERFEYTIDKPRGTFRIISLGDSWTYGWGVPTRDNYSEILEDLLNDKLSCENFEKFEVLNLGLQGYDIEYAAERFRVRGQKYDPDLVIWMIRDDDFFPTDLILQGIQSLKENGGFDAKGAFYWASRKRISEKIGTEEMITYQMEALNLFNNYYKNALLFLSYRTPSREIAAIEDFVRLRENTYAYKTSILSDEEIIPNDDHPNREGHRAFAEGLFRYIAKNNIIPCD